MLVNPQVGDVVYCTDLIGDLEEDVAYNIMLVTPNQTAIQVRRVGVGDQMFPLLGPRFRVDRFVEAGEYHAAWAEAEEPDELEDPDFEIEADFDDYEVDEFLGCCGVDTVFFSTVPRLTRRRMQDLHDNQLTLRSMYLAVLTEKQREGSEGLLQEFGWEFLKSCRSREGNHNLHLYCFIRNPAV